MRKDRGGDAGNPLALLELPRGLSPAQLAGGFGLPNALALPRRIEETFQRRLETLPSDTRLLLLAAAAEPVGDLALVVRAAQRLGISPQALGAAEAAGLLELGARVRFRHPLVRSAVYHGARLGDRQRVHRALAERPMPRPTPTAARGTAHTERLASTRRLPRSLNGRPLERRDAAGSPPRLRSFNEPST